MFLAKVDGYQKLCDINKNVTKTGWYLERRFPVVVVIGSVKIHVAGVEVLREMERQGWNSVLCEFQISTPP
jgi:hypothetical protein